MMLETEPDRIGGQAFNVSDLVADTREILTPFHGPGAGTSALPAPADKAAVAEMDTSKIRALGWKPGGRALFEETLAQLVAKA